MIAEATAATPDVPAVQAALSKNVKGLRKNGMHCQSVNGGFYSQFSPGKQWREQKKAFRPTAGLTSYALRAEQRKALVAVKEKEKEMKDEKAAERQVCSYFPFSSSHW